MASKRVLVYGGRGALGSVLVDHFKAAGWWVCSIDVAANDAANANVLVATDVEWTVQADHVASEVGKAVGGPAGKVDAILNMAGGWAGGNAKSKDLVKNSDMMWKQSVWSSCISASLAAKHLKEGGCVVLPGAKAALEGTPGMIGYGMAKAAVHQLVKSLSAPQSGLADGSVCYALLPVTLDTPMNRKWMPDADHSTWTSLGFIAELLLKWSEGMERPADNGSLVQLVTKDGDTKLVCE